MKSSLSLQYHYYLVFGYLVLRMHVAIVGRDRAKASLSSHREIVRSFCTILGQSGAKLVPSFAVCGLTSSRECRAPGYYYFREP